MALAALSFLVPLLWLIGVWFSGGRSSTRSASTVGAARGRAAPAGRGKEKADGRAKAPRKKAASRSRKASVPAVEPAAASWRLSPFRLLLFAAFSYLSLQATRNSHQFAAVVGAVTAWNFGEWAAAVRRRRAERQGASTPTAATRS